MQCAYLDTDGKPRPAVMGCYGIGVTRMAAAWIEQNHDDKGIIWSLGIAPYHVHLIGLNLENDQVKEQAENFYVRLQKNDIEILFDDQPARADKKFSDADLINLPIRLTLSKRTVEQDKVEYKLRQEKEADLLSLDEIVERIKATLAARVDKE